jgi:hypothetical protein
VNSSTGRGEGEDEIIVLDKENVNPGAFRRKREKGKEKKESGHTREQKESRSGRAEQREECEEIHFERFHGRERS